MATTADYSQVACDRLDDEEMWSMNTAEHS